MLLFDVTEQTIQNGGGSRANLILKLLEANFRLQKTYPLC